MKLNKHPYQDLESLKAWKILDKAIKDLVANGDLEELTPRAYIVGHILRKLQDAKALAPNLTRLNGVHKISHHEPANRG